MKILGDPSRVKLGKLESKDPPVLSMAIRV